MMVCCGKVLAPTSSSYPQTINDYFDRELDAINEPYRPIPSGAKLSLLVVQLIALNGRWCTILSATYCPQPTACQPRGDLGAGGYCAVLDTAGGGPGRVIHPG